MSKTRYKFLREGMKSEHGDCSWTLNEWKHHDTSLELCNSGFHASKEIWEAFSYVQGEILALVEVKGNHMQQAIYSTFHDALTQVCFVCLKIRSTIKR